MSDLTDLRTRLVNQFLDPNNLVLNADQLDEAIRSALEALCHQLGEHLTLAGLDLAIETTLDEFEMAIVLSGAAAFASEFLVRHRLSHSSTNLSADAALLQWSSNLRRQFERQLESLRLDELQQTEELTYAPWEWDEPSDWEADDWTSPGSSA